jgi:hypothetical protein
MTKRTSLTKKIRFEVFKRDSFTCQYCGRTAPSVLLEVDHIKPVSKDGTNDITNLITSCFDCNHGKSDRELSDDAVVAKRKKQLDELQERREQIEMMMDWQGGLDVLRDEELSSAAGYINKKVAPYTVNEQGEKTIRAALRKYGLKEFLECVNISFEQYSEMDDNGKITPESVQKVFDYITKIAANRKRLEEKPFLRDLFYVRGILKKRFTYLGYDVMKILEEAYLSGIDFEELKSIAIISSSYNKWTDIMREEINGK